MNRERKIKGLTVEVKNDNVTVALRKLKNRVEDCGVLQTYLEKQHYEKPSVTRKKRKSAAKARWQKYLASQQLPPKQF